MNTAADGGEGGASAAADDAGTGASAASEEELVSFKVVFAKQTYQIEFGMDRTVAELKQHLEKETNCPVVQQKLMYKGPVKDTDTLRKKKFKKNCKVLLVGATAAQILKVTMDGVPDLAALANSLGGGATGGAAASSGSTWEDKPEHTKMLKKGKPAEVAMGFEPYPGDRPEPLPDVAIKPLYTSLGKVRLHIKLDEGTVVLSTNKGQEKYAIQNVADVISKRIEGHPGYSIIGLQLGNSRAWRYIYWFPSQYVPALKNTCGKGAFGKR